MQNKQFKLIVGGPQLFIINFNFIYFLFLYLQIEIILLLYLVAVQIQNLFYFNKKQLVLMFCNMLHTDNTPVTKTHAKQLCKYGVLNVAWKKTIIFNTTK
jgi:hypothetical protein